MILTGRKGFAILTQRAESEGKARDIFDRQNLERQGVYMAKLRLGALEAGGTKMVCAIGDENGEIYEQISIPTTMPKETIPK